MTTVTQIPSLLELLAENTHLKAENEKLRADAARYQWLREGNFTGQWLLREAVGGWTDGMDAAIDAAMKGQP